MKKLKILSAKSPSENIMYIIAVFTLIAILFTFAKVAELVTEGLNGLTGGKLNIPVPLFQTTSANLAMIGAGLFLFVLGAIIAVPIIKFAVIVVGISLVAIALRNVFRTFSGKAGESPLPSDLTKK